MRPNPAGSSHYGDALASTRPTSPASTPMAATARQAAVTRAAAIRRRRVDIRPCMTATTERVGDRLAGRMLFAVDALIGWLALWQVAALVAVYGGLSFDALTALGVVALTGLAMPYVTRSAEGGQPSEPATPDPRGVALAVLLALAAVIAYDEKLLTVAPVCFMVAPLAALYVAPRARVGLPAVVEGRWPDAVSVLITGAAAALLTAFLRRADVDDGYYLNAILQTLLHPNWPAYGFDGIHGEPGAPMQQVIHRPQTYELLVAWFCRWTGVPGREAYWIAVPSIAAAASALTHWALARVVAPRVAWLAVPIAFAVLVMWGDGGQTIGRFGFQRLFQGKSIFVTVMLPLVMYAALRFVGAPSWRSALRLVAAQLAATVFTSTALVVVPMATALGVGAGWHLSRRGAGVVAAGWATAAPVVGVLGWMAYELHQAGGLASEGHLMADNTAIGARRAALVLVGLAGLPWWAAGRDGATWAARWVQVALLVLLNGVTPALLGEGVAGLLNWRTFWAIPFAPLLGIAMASALGSITTARQSAHDAVRVVAGVAWLWAFSVEGLWAIEKEGVSIEFAALKTRDKHEVVADEVLRFAGVDQMVAAPPHISQALAMREAKPRLVGVWLRYIVNLTRFWGPIETAQRTAVLEFTRANVRVTPADDLDALCVDVLVTERSVRTATDAEAVLPTLGFKRVREVASHDIWTRPPPAGCDVP